MAEYINREDVIAKLRDVEAKSFNNFYEGVVKAHKIVAESPAADVRPVKRGRWKLNKDGSGICSECGRTQTNCWDADNWDNFCHHCGADMRED